MRFLRELSAAFIVLSSSACAGSAQLAETPSAEAPRPPRAWAEMSHDERQEWMVNEVLPRMTTVFAEYDHNRYEGFGCRNCHGPNAREEAFRMPSPSLPALYPTGSPEQRQMVREYPEGVRCMFNRVVPTMQTLLGAPEYDAATGQGFSCYSCHPHAGDEGTTPILLRGLEHGGDGAI